MTTSYAGLQKLLLCSFTLLASTPAFAQITPDNTLGAESSRLTPNVTINGAEADRIDGGATRSSNLFHSFSSFNVGDGQRVYFGNPAGIQNILTRVTGGNASNILGTLGVDGGANLFLINPNGIIFGQNAQLDVRGSFVGTTANAMGFGDLGFFSATDPSAPPLLTVNPSVLLFTQLNPGAIANQGVLTAGRAQSLVLVGGNITFDGGGAVVVGSRLELGGLAGAGAVGLTGSGNELRLNFPAGVPRADVVLQNEAAAFTTDGGPITLQTGNLNLSGNSFISTTLQTGEGTPDSPAGDVVINATGAVTVDGDSGISSIGFDNSLGDSGNITIDAQSIRLNNRSLINTRSQKNRGSIRLNATEDVTLDGGSGIFTVGAPDSIGNSGNITVNARNINLSNRSAINSGNIGRGRSGRTTLQAQDAIALSSSSSIQSGSFASAFDGTNSEASGDIEIAARSLSLDGQYTFISSTNLDAGRAGDVRITTDDSISLNDYAYITASTRGQGDGGNIQLQTRSLTLSNGSYIDTLTAEQGNSGNLLVNASDSVTLSGTAVLNLPDGESLIRGSSLSTAAQGSGNSGQITINTGRISIHDGGYILTRTYPESGQGGDLTINASEAVEVVGADPSGGFSRIDTSTSGSGNAGDVTINTSRLSIRDGAIVGTNTFAGSTGQGGDLTVNASDSIEIVGASPDDLFNSVITTYSVGSGDAGRISIDTRRLSFRNGASISASTVGSGRGGDININATDSVEIEANPADTDTADGIFTSTLGSGDAGDLFLRTQRLSVRNGGVVSASTGGSTGRGGNVTINASDSVEVVGISNDGRLPSLFSVRSQGEGVAGNVTVNSPRISIQDRGAINADSNTVDGGNINLNTNNLLLRRNGTISATAGAAQGAGNGGNITIDADFIIAVPEENSDITANAFQGRGGNVQISTQGIFGIQPRSQVTPLSDITASSDQDVQGQIDITRPDVQPEQGVLELPDSILDTTNQIAQACPNAATAARPLGEFVVTGRGSLPPNPLELLTGTSSLSPLAALDGETQANQPQQTSSKPAIAATSNPIVEAQGWVRTASGIALVAHAPQATPNATTTQAACPRFQ